MRVNVAIVLDEGDQFTMTPEEAATAVIAALDGVESDKDHCSVTITQSQHGGVGYLPPPLPAPPATEGDVIPPDPNAP